MLSKLEQLPNPQGAPNAQSLLPTKTRSSQRRGGQKFAEEDGPYIEPEGTGDFNKDSPGNEAQLQGGKAQKAIITPQKKRDAKNQ